MTALRQGMCRYSFIAQLMRSFKGATVLSMVPSYAFSSALAAYYQSKAGVATTPDTATGVHEPGSQPELDAKLISAICSFPAALLELVKALQEKVGCQVRIHPAFPYHCTYHVIYATETACDCY